MAVDILVFGGTTEGRLLAEWLADRGTCGVVYCAATEYGASLAPAAGSVTTVRGPLSREQKDRLMRERDVAVVVDATHPFARHISQSIDELAAAWGTDVVRVVRPASRCDDDTCVEVADVREAAGVVARASGTVLLTTGTRDLAAFVGAMPDYAERLFVRVLPVAASLAAARDAGIPTSHIVAMQGPFSADFNAALVRELGVRTMVTKQSGREGGFDQKLQAARACGIRLVVVGRPQERSGDSGVTLDECKRILEERYGL